MKCKFPGLLVFFAALLVGQSSFAKNCLEGAAIIFNYAQTPITLEGADTFKNNLQKLYRSIPRSQIAIDIQVWMNTMNSQYGYLHGLTPDSNFSNADDLFRAIYSKDPSIKSRFFCFYRSILAPFLFPEMFVPSSSPEHFLDWKRTIHGVVMLEEMLPTISRLYRNQ